MQLQESGCNWANHILVVQRSLLSLHRHYRNIPARRSNITEFGIKIWLNQIISRGIICSQIFLPKRKYSLLKLLISNENSGRKILMKKDFVNTFPLKSAVFKTEWKYFSVKLARFISNWIQCQKYKQTLEMLTFSPPSFSSKASKILYTIFAGILL